LHTSKRVHSRPKAPLAVFPQGLQRAVAAGRRPWGTRTGQRKMAFGLPIHGGITRATLYRYVSPTGELRDHGKRVLAR
jgi:hypothetical protein